MNGSVLIVRVLQLQTVKINWELIVSKVWKLSFQRSIQSAGNSPLQDPNDSGHIVLLLISFLISNVNFRDQKYIFEESVMQNKST